MSVPEEREFPHQVLLPITEVAATAELVAPEEDLSFSKVRGYRLENFDTQCSVDAARVCPAKVKLVSEYTRHITKGSFRKAFEEGDRSPDDIRNVVLLKLREYGPWSSKADYTNVESNQCPTREVMDESAVRKSGVNMFRSLKKAIAKIGA